MLSSSNQLTLRLVIKTSLFVYQKSGESVAQGLRQYYSMKDTCENVGKDRTDKIR